MSHCIQLCVFVFLSFLCHSHLVCAQNTTNNTHTEEEIIFLNYLEDLTVDAIEHNHQTVRNSCSHLEEINNSTYCKCISTQCFDLPMEEENMPAYHKCFLDCLCNTTDTVQMPFSRGKHYGRLHLTSTRLLEQEKTRYCS